MYGTWCRTCRLRSSRYTRRFFFLFHLHQAHLTSLKTEVQKWEVTGPRSPSEQDRTGSCAPGQTTSFPTHPCPLSTASLGPEVALLIFVLGSYWAWSAFLYPRCLTFVLYPAYQSDNLIGARTVVLHLGCRLESLGGHLKIRMLRLHQNN